MDGWLIIDKPLGITSAQAVAKVKRFLRESNKVSSSDKSFDQIKKKIEKVGHAGTLDPLASGILPIAIGQATKLMRFLFDASKEYIFTVKWGESTETDDCEGKIIATSDKIPTMDEIIAILPKFIGEIEQVPPIYSAIKVNGKRSYDLARQGADFILSGRKVIIHKLELLSHDNDSSQFKVTCGKGTYIRALARDMAILLSSYGHISYLRRTRVGNFALDRSILLENLEPIVYKTKPLGLLLPMESVLVDIPVLSFSLEERQSLICGREMIKDTGLKSGIIAALYSDQDFFALGEVTGNVIKPIRVFNFT